MKINRKRRETPFRPITKTINIATMPRPRLMFAIFPFGYRASRVCFLYIIMHVSRLVNAKFIESTESRVNSLSDRMRVIHTRSSQNPFKRPCSKFYQHDITNCKRIPYTNKLYKRSRSGNIIILRCV